MNVNTRPRDHPGLNYNPRHRRINISHLTTDRIMRSSAQIVLQFTALHYDYPIWTDYTDHTKPFTVQLCWRVQAKSWLDWIWMMMKPNDFILQTHGNNKAIKMWNIIRVCVEIEYEEFIPYLHSTLPGETIRRTMVGHCSNVVTALVPITDWAPSSEDPCSGPDHITTHHSQHPSSSVSNL